MMRLVLGLSCGEKQCRGLVMSHIFLCVSGARLGQTKDSKHGYRGWKTRFWRWMARWKAVLGDVGHGDDDDEV